MYAHGSDEDAYDKALDIGLSEDAAKMFHPLYEVAFEIEVYEDGRVSYLEVKPDGNTRLVPSDDD